MFASTTIAALSSPAGCAPEAILRLSGPRAFALVDPCFRADHGPWPPPSRYAAGEGWLDLAGLSVPATVYRMTAPSTYTGEDVAELHLPGNPLLAHRLLEALLAAGAELAGPGEFTRRAFENGRIDLAQAESIMALIRSRSEAEARAALAGVSGAFSEEIGAIGRALLELSGTLEASLDFSDRGLGDDLAGAAREQLGALRQQLDLLLGAPQDAPRSDLPRVLLYGPTNAGKSTLFNALLGRPRAVVDPRPGTTRDPVRAEATLGGARCELVDPAGVGAPLSEIDGRAQELAARELDAADLVLLVSDGPMLALPEGLSASFIRVRSKADLVAQVCPGEEVAVSAHTGAGLDTLCDRVRQALESAVDRSGSRFLLSTRQRAALRAAFAALERAAGLLDDGQPAELAAFELALARAALGQVTGLMLADDVLGAIFAQFCIGK